MSYQSHSFLNSHFLWGGGCEKWSFHKSSLTGFVASELSFAEMLSKRDTIFSLSPDLWCFLWIEVLQITNLSPAWVLFLYWSLSQLTEAACYGSILSLNWRHENFQLFCIILFFLFCDWKSNPTPKKPTSQVWWYTVPPKALTLQEVKKISSNGNDDDDN